MDFDALDEHAVEAIARSVPMAMRVEMAKSAARDQDMRVLKAMTAAGCFDFSPDMLKVDYTKSNRHISYARHEIPIIAAWACILENTSPASKPKEHRDGGSGGADQRPPRTFIEPVTEEFKTAFRAMIGKFANDALDHMAEVAKDKRADRLDMSLFDTFLSLGAAACAMNDSASVTEAVGSLAWMSKFGSSNDVPSHARLTPNVLGFDPDLTRKVKFGREHDMHRSYPVRVSPWTLALEFDAQDALAALANHVHAKTLATEAAQYMIEKNEGRPISAPELFAEGWVGASADAWRQMMKGIDSTHTSPAVREAVSALTASAIKGKSGNPWLSAVFETGMQKFDPTGAVKTCMESKDGEALIQKLRSDIPWERESAEEGHILFDVAVRARLYRRFSGTEVLNSLLHIAKEDGHWESLLRAVKPAKNKLGGDSDTVFENLAHHGCTEGYLTMLELGFDPRQPGPSGESALQRIQTRSEPVDGLENKGSAFANNNNALQVIRSWQARTAAHEALGELQPQSFPGP